MKNLLLTFALLMLPFSFAHAKSEAEYVNDYCICEGCKIEYKLDAITMSKKEYEQFGSTRVDCLTNAYAIEFDYARKWAEAIGQSLHYSLMTKKKAGIVLIMKEGSEADLRHLEKMTHIIESNNLDIRIWTVDVE